jgi:hypothetical protein
MSKGTLGMAVPSTAYSGDYSALDLLKRYLNYTRCCVGKKCRSFVDMRIWWGGGPSGFILMSSCQGTQKSR